MICPIPELRPRITALLQLEARKYTFSLDFFDRISYFFFAELRDEDYQQHVHRLVFEHLKEIKDCLANVSDEHWNIASLNKAIEELNEFMGRAGKEDSEEQNGLRKDNQIAAAVVS